MHLSWLTYFSQLGNENNLTEIKKTWKTLTNKTANYFQRILGHLQLPQKSRPNRSDKDQQSAAKHPTIRQICAAPIH